MYKALRARRNEPSTFKFPMGQRNFTKYYGDISEHILSDDENDGHTSTPKLEKFPHL